MNESYHPETKSPIKFTKRAKTLGTIAAMGLVGGGLVVALEGAKVECPEVPNASNLQTLANPTDRANVGGIPEGQNIRFSPSVCTDNENAYDNLATTTDTKIDALPKELYADPSDPNGRWAGYQTKDVVYAARPDERKALTDAFKNDKDGIVWVNIG